MTTENPEGKNIRKKSPIEWLVILGLGFLFAAVWLYAHWNLSRQPPYSKRGPTDLPSPQIEANHSQLLP